MYTQLPLVVEIKDDLPLTSDTQLPLKPDINTIAWNLINDYEYQKQAQNEALNVLNTIQPNRFDSAFEALSKITTKSAGLINISQVNLLIKQATKENAGSFARVTSFLDNNIGFCFSSFVDQGSTSLILGDNMREVCLTFTENTEPLNTNQRKLIIHIFETDYIFDNSSLISGFEIAARVCQIMQGNPVIIDRDLNNLKFELDNQQQEKEIMDVSEDDYLAWRDELDLRVAFDVDRDQTGYALQVDAKMREYELKRDTLLDKYIQQRLPNKMVDTDRLPRAVLMVLYNDSLTPEAARDAVLRLLSEKHINIEDYLDNK